MVLTVGSHVGPYEITGLLGAGGMGEAYRARDLRLSHDVAVKVLPAEWASDSERLHRFEQEARAAAAFNHPNLLAVYDVGADQGPHNIVSELLDGQSLRDRLSGGHCLSGRCSTIRFKSSAAGRGSDHVQTIGTS